MMNGRSGAPRPRPRRAAAWLALALGVGVGVSAVAQGGEPVSPKLTPTLRDLLREEMIAIEDASKQILSALIAGEDARVAELAQRIHDSFILQQEMTDEDRAALMEAVPTGFVEQDRAFHGISAALADAARAKDRARQHEEYGRMLEACSACHADYATDRFPTFGE